MVDQEHAHEAGPEEGGEGALEVANEPSDAGRDHQSERDPEREQPVDDSHAAVLEEVGRVLLGIDGRGVVEEPAHVRVPEPAQGAGRLTVVVHVRAVGVALGVGEGVVLAVV